MLAGQEVNLRWVSSHQNLFCMAVVSAVDEHVLWQENFFDMMDDYVASAPDSANHALRKPR